MTRALPLAAVLFSITGCSAISTAGSRSLRRMALAVARTGGRVREVGDLSAVVAFDTLDATGAFLHPRAEALVGSGDQMYLTIGGAAALDVRDGADVRSRLRPKIED